MSKKLNFFFKIKPLLIFFCFLIISIAFYYLFYGKRLQQTPIKFYLFQTSDTHGYLDNVGAGSFGGWLRLGNVMKKQIERVGGYENCLLIDCGDTFQGTVEASETKGKFAIPIMNNLKYDVFVPGNHDFDFGIDNFLTRINGLKADVIAANFVTAVKSQKEILQWKTYTKNNIKIAVIGMTSPYLKYWLWGKGHERYNVASLSETLDKVMPDILKAKPDIIILAIHHGLYNSKRFPGKDNFLRTVIKQYPQIDVVLGGHTHQTYPGEILYNNSVYVQPGAHAQYVSKIEIEVDKTGKKPPQIKTELIPVLSIDQPNKQLVNITSERIRKSKLKREKIIGRTNVYIGDKGIPGDDNKMSELFANAVLSAVKADVAMCTVIRSGYTLSGSITYNDIFNICPYEDTIVILSLNYLELGKIIEEQNTYKDKYRKRLGLHGAGLVENRKNLHCLFNGKDRVNVAFSSYDVAGAGNRYPILKEIAQKSDVGAFDTQILLRSAVVKFFRDKSLEEK